MASWEGVKFYTTTPICSPFFCSPSPPSQLSCTKNEEKGYFLDAVLFSFSLWDH